VLETYLGLEGFDSFYLELEFFTKAVAGLELMDFQEGGSFHAKLRLHDVQVTKNV
jgi:hypothetical protein